MLLGELGVAHGTADVSVLRVDDLCVKDPVSEAHHPVLIGAQTQLVISEIMIAFFGRSLDFSYLFSPLDQLILNWTASGGQVLLVGKTDYNLAGAGRLVQSTLLDPGLDPFEISISHLRSSGKMGRGLPPFSVGQTPIFLLILV